jgi:hypothetical protein
VSACQHDVERLRDLGWYRCPNCGAYVGERAIPQREIPFDDYENDAEWALTWPVVDTNVESAQ